MDSTVGLIIQFVGISMVSILSLFMVQTIKSAFVKYWTAAWLFLSLSLLSLIISFHFPQINTPGYSLYFFGEYAFGYLFYSGCFAYANQRQICVRHHHYALLICLGIAIGLPHLSSDFNNLFIVQALLMSAWFGAAFVALRKAYHQRHPRPGERVMAIALVALMIDFFHYVPMFGSRLGRWQLPVPASYLKYTSIFDLILEMLLGFGTVMVLMESVSHELEEANRSLTAARDQLEITARTDPLTGALNRHAYDKLVAQTQVNAGGTNQTGCVAIIDLDNLKTINDTFGHLVGDSAIRAVAQSIRSLIRPDDVLLRWGGDEFLLLLFGLSEEEANRRLAKLNRMLAATQAFGSKIELLITVSYGIKNIDDASGIDRAIEGADQAMYRLKQERKRALV